MKLLLGKNNEWTKEAESQLMGRGVQHSNTEWRMIRRAGNDKPNPWVEEAAC